MTFNDFTTQLLVADRLTSIINSQQTIIAYYYCLMELML